jgi:small-conductance mechanosensitive channel
MTLSFFVEKNVIGNYDETIKKRFDQDGIKLPFPYQILVYKKDYYLLAKKASSNQPA